MKTGPMIFEQCSVAKDFFINILPGPPATATSSYSYSYSTSTVISTFYSHF